MAEYLLRSYENQGQIYLYQLQVRSKDPEDDRRTVVTGLCSEDLGAVLRGALASMALCHRDQDIGLIIEGKFPGDPLARFIGETRMNVSQLDNKLYIDANAAHLV